MPKTYDIILYGATGLTGSQAAAYLGQFAPEGLTWAVAGRDRRRLEEVAASSGSRGSQPGIIVADGGDRGAVEAAVKEGRVVASTAGPFALYGGNMIAACAKHGTDYVDITGETVFVRRMIDRHEQQARVSGAKIIPCCGFDAVPSDLGAYLAVRHIRDVLRSRARAVRGYYSIKGGLNGGTFATMLNMFESGDWTEMKNPGLLAGGKNGRPGPAGSIPGARYDRDVRSWTAPFLMGVINTPVVYRSAALFDEWGEGYGGDFSYQEHHRIGGPWNPLPALAVAGAIKTVDRLGHYRLMRKALRRFGPRPGEGPTVKSMEEGFFSFQVVAEAEDGSSVALTMAGDGDPGNRATVKFLCESAFALATERDGLPGGASRSGFLTPATGLGTVLAERLKKSGVSMEILGVEKRRGTAA